MLSTLLNTPVTITRRSTADEDDTYGVRTTTETVVETVGELQQQRRTEPGDQGETSDTTWLLVLPAGTDIDTSDAVEVDGQVFEMTGAPWEARNPRTGAVSHLEATVRRTGTVTGS